MIAKSAPFALHSDRLFPPEPQTRALARELYASVARLPILSPHGHADPQWFADDARFPDPARLWQDQRAPVFAILCERVRLRENWPATLSGHIAVYEAIRAHEPAAAKAAMRARLSQALRVMTGEADGEESAAPPPAESAEPPTPRRRARR